VFGAVMLPQRASSFLLHFSSAKLMLRKGLRLFVAASRRQTRLHDSHIQKTSSAPPLEHITLIVEAKDAIVKAISDVNDKAIKAISAANDKLLKLKDERLREKDETIRVISDHLVDCKKSRDMYQAQLQAATGQLGRRSAYELGLNAAWVEANRDPRGFSSPPPSGRRCNYTQMEAWLFNLQSSPVDATRFPTCECMSKCVQLGLYSVLSVDAHGVALNLDSLLNDPGNLTTMQHGAIKGALKCVGVAGFHAQGMNKQC